MSAPAIDWTRPWVIIPDMSEGVYHGDPCPEPSLSSTLARVALFETPLHAWHRHPWSPLYEPENKRVFDLGRAAHTVLLGKGGAIVQVNADSYRTKDAKEARDDAYDQGATPLLGHEMDATMAMAAAAQEQLAGISGGNPLDPAEEIEHSHFAQIDSVWCRARPDVVNRRHGALYDYKTTSSLARVEDAAKAICNLGYDVQAAHYLDVVSRIHGEAPRFRFIVQERRAPYALCVVELGADWLATARRKAERARAIWRRCLDAGEWPGLPNRIATLDAPEWHDRAWYDRESFEESVRQQTGRDVLDMAHRLQAPLERRRAAE